MKTIKRGPLTVLAVVLAALLLGAGAYAYRNAQASERPRIQTNGPSNSSMSNEHNERNGQHDRDNDGDE
jgi:uncharacterized protein HemX